MPRNFLIYSKIKRMPFHLSGTFINSIPYFRLERGEVNVKNYRSGGENEFAK